MLSSRIVNTLEYETKQLYTVQEWTEEKKAEEETKAPEPMKAMDTKQESAATC
jgi:hypothetical protein